MKISKLSYKGIISIVLIMSFLNFTACSPQKKPETLKSSSAEEKKPPKELDELRSVIEKVEELLNSLYEEGKKPLFIQQEKIEKKAKEESHQQKGEGSSEGQQGGNSGSSEGGSSSGNGGQQQGQAQQQQQKLTAEELKLKLQQENYKSFEEIKNSVMELHSAWNNYEPKAIADFAIQSSINDFESTLNNLTKTVEMNDAYLSLLEVNQLYKFLPDFYMLYDAEVPPDLDRIRYSINKIKLLTEKDDYTGASNVLQYLDGIWMNTRNKLKSTNAEMMSKFEFALSDLKNSVNAKNKMIVEAKSEVLLKLIEEFKKAAEK